MRLLYLDTSAYAPVSPWFDEALRELGTEHEWMDTAEWPQSPAGPANAVLIVDWPPWVTPAWLAARRAEGATIIRLNPDDPWNPAVRGEPLSHLPLYDLYVTPKTAIVDDLRRAGARRVEYLPCAYKPRIHFRETPGDETERARFACDVAVIGGADAERLHTVHALRRALPCLQLRLYGGYWERDRRLRPFARGIVRGRDYRLAIGGARVCLNLLRTANRDQHNMRTFEIPACGGVQLTAASEERRAWNDGWSYGVDELHTAVVALLLEDTTSERQASEAWAAPHTYTARLRQLLAWAEA